MGSIRAHDFRGVSTPVAFHRNWSVSAVLDAATWSSSSFFFPSFYLRDLQHEFQGLRSLGPFVVRIALPSSRFAMGEEEVLCRPCPRCSVAPRPVFSYWLWWPALPVPVRVLGFPILMLFSYVFIVCSLYVYFIYLYYACPSLFLWYPAIDIVWLGPVFLTLGSLSHFALHDSARWSLSHGRCGLQSLSRTPGLPLLTLTHVLTLQYSTCGLGCGINPQW